MTYDDNDGPILYVLMRSDAPDFMPGKAMAQANHAGTQFITEAGKFFGAGGTDNLTATYFRDWITEGDGFGTCVVLSVLYPQLISRLALAEAMGQFCGVVTDETYPVRDGHRMQTLEIDTCGWIFGLKSELAPLLSELRMI